jgi:hypothetical protein
MKATTIKLEGELLESLEASKPRDQSLTAYVRTVLRENLDRIEVREAAVAYRAFVESHEDEKALLDEWDRADLNTPPRSKNEGS